MNVIRVLLNISERIFLEKNITVKMHNPGNIVIFCVFTHNVVYNTDIMVSMLVKTATAENSLKVMRNPDLSTSLTYI